MPKVIGHDPNIAKQATCKKCGAINEYLPNEERMLFKGKDISGCTEITKGFNCGQCGAEVITHYS